MLEILLHYRYPRLLILSCHILITKPILILHKYIDNISSDNFKILREEAYKLELPTYQNFKQYYCYTLTNNISYTVYSEI